ncbi:MAG: metallophosphoesterase family protein [Clostridia bacterium]|nr:metallophosphoesterase family protein [Clostridia bacterium]
MITKQEWKNIRGSSPKPDQIMLSIKGDAAHNMTVRWRTDTSVEGGYALFRAEGTENWSRAEALKHPFNTDMDESIFFFADMTGLLADTKYEYTCGDDENRSEVYTFKTTKENATKFSFLCMSDVQGGGAEPPADYSVLNFTLKKMLSEHPECDFILTAGDNTNCGQTDIQWTGLFEGLKGIMEYIPVMFNMGNHDDMGFSSYFTCEDKYYSEYAEYFTNQLWGSYEHNGPVDRPIANHSFVYGNAMFCCTGTSGYEEMNDWLIDRAENSNETWKFAVHHFPVNYAGPQIEINDTYPSMRDGMDKFDMVFSGHEHSFARSYPRRGEGLFDKPSEGTIHYNIGSGHRNPPGTRVVPKVWNAKTYCHEEDLSMFSIVDIDGDKCTVTAYVEDGRIVDQCIVDKGRDLILPYDPAPVYNRPRLKFKGYDLGICVAHNLPQNIKGVWYIPIGQLMSFIGADVERTEGKIRVGVYGRTAEFTENSTTVITDDGSYEMEAPCLRLEEGQLYAPMDGFCKHLHMQAYYYEHNNFIDIASDNERISVPFQP